MSYVDGYSAAIAQIGQIQSVFSTAAAGVPPSGFEAVLQQVSSLSSLLGSPAPATPAVPDLSDSFGYPLEEGDPIPPGTGESDAPGNVATGASTGLSNDAATGLGTSASAGFGTSSAATEMGYQLSGASGAVSASQASGSSQTGGTQEANGSSESGSFGASVVSDAEKYLGVPYQWGGTNPAQGVDCSGLVQDVFADLGTTLPRTSQEQATTGMAVPDLAAAEPGDLVFFPGTDGTASAPGHVGIYIGNGQMIDAPYTGVSVRVDPVGNPVAIRRIAGPAASSAGYQPTTAAATSSTSATTSNGAPDEPASLPAGTNGLYGADFAGAAAGTGVPEALLNAVASTESSFRPGAVSSAGAEGLMQLMPSTAASLGVNPFNARQAINAAAQLLSNYHEQFGSWSLALAAYNAGPAAVQSYSGIPPYTQTQNYVQTVLSRAGMEGQ